MPRIAPKVAIAIIVLTALMSAESVKAAGYIFMPTNTAFTATGSVTLLGDNGGRVDCALLVGGAINKKGIGSITSAAVTGAGNCSGIEAMGLPWIMRAGYPNKIKMSGWTLYVPYLSRNCGPGAVELRDETTVWPIKRSYIAGCVVTGGELSPTPTLSIVAGP